MAYVQGGVIEASDFNTFRTQLLNVYGTGFGNSGYGQTAITVPTVAGGFVELVKSSEWQNLRSAIEACATHQGTSTALLPPATDLNVGAVIAAHDGVTDPGDIGQMLSDISTNRLISAVGSTTNFFNVYSDSVTNAWSTQATTTIDINWATADEARYFFNAGGQVILRFSRSGGSATPQNTDWTNLLSSVGSIFMDHNNTSSTGSGVGQPVGYYTLNLNTYQDVFTASTGSATYAGNNVRVRAQTRNSGGGANGDNGRTIRFEVQFNDSFTGGFSDVVDGTLQVIVDERHAVTPDPLNVNTFSVATVNGLVAV